MTAPFQQLNAKVARPVCAGLSRLAAAQIENILAVFLYSCPTCLGKTLPDFIKDVANVDRKVGHVAELGHRRDKYLKDKLEGIEKSLASLSSTFDARVAAVEAKNDTILRSLGENRSSSIPALHALEESVSLVSRKLDCLSSQMTNSSLSSQQPEISSTPSLLDTTIVSVETKLSELCEKLSTLNSIVLADRPPAPAASSSNDSFETPYPTPNEATPDGGMWMTIGSSRFWASDLDSLKKLRAREKNKLRRQTRRRERRREARLRSRQTLNGNQDSQPSENAPTHEHSNQQPRSILSQSSSIQSQIRAANRGNSPQSHSSSLQQATESQVDVQPQNQPAIDDGSAPLPDPLRAHTPGTETWIYISGVANDVTAAAVKEYISEKLNRQNVECHLLLPSNVDPRTRRSLSFKARIPSTCGYIALDTSFWPTGVKAWYFVAYKYF